MSDMLNSEIAQRFLEVAHLLHEQGANPYRVQAYRHAADTLRHLDRPVAEILQMEGVDGLQRLPGIGETLARAISILVSTGRLPMLDRLRGEADPVAVLTSVPGIGEAMATRLSHDLGIETLEELEIAAHDGRLSMIEGIGEKKLAGIIDSLAGRLGRIRPAGRERSEAAHGTDPTVEELLDVDRQYREQAARGRLRLIAPRRFNPDHTPWLPVLHTQRGDRHYTALFSNTARAHRMGTTRDWVILYYDHGRGEHQCTVITAQRPPMQGKRIIRGRETECEKYYEAISGRLSAISRS